jgi:oxygen-independent coproporphyrinogen-3 oxidase
MEDWRAGGFGLYLHWPFCQSKCPYCDFNSHVAASIDQRRWQRAYLAEIDRIGAETRGRVLNTVANDWEVTLEANPGSVEAERFRAYREAGVNRLSMGVQALNDTDLRRLGRLHSLDEALGAFETARASFDRVSFDLIYARQDQTPDDWGRELDRALRMAVDHLSLYQLTIEDGTAFGARHAAGGLRGLPDDDRSVALYDMTQDRCAAAGMPAYEVSNHARPGAESRHNLIYWRGGDYAGIGPGAHGRLTLNGQRYATEAPRAPGAWLERVERDGCGEAPRTGMTGPERATEYLLMSLRLSEGSDTGRFTALNGRPLDATRIRDLEDLGMISVSDGRIVATAQGRMVLNAILRQLLSD